MDSVLRWHPTEASGLLAAAALGLRGKVEVRDAGDQVELTDATPVIHAVDLAMAAYALPASRARGHDVARAGGEAPLRAHRALRAAVRD